MIRDNWPEVSIVIPCFNEREFIGGCLDSIIASSYPLDRLEVIIADGMSDDGTRDIIAHYSQKHRFIRVVDNPHRFKPHALNIGIKAAKGDIIIRMDAHAVYDANYISKSVGYLEEYQADNVGGLLVTLANKSSVIAKSIACSLSSKFGVGDSTFRSGAKGFRWVDTVFGGCYRREIFGKIGLFNEALIRGQDREFNIRLQNEGGKILFAPDIISHYYARGTLKSYVPWIFSAGMTPFFVSRLIGKRIYSWRNLAPPAFVLSLVSLPLASFVDPVFLCLFSAEIAAYICYAMTAAISVAKREQDWRFLFSMPFIFLLTHASYGAGALFGLVKPLKEAGEWTKV